MRGACFVDTCFSLFLKKKNIGKKKKKKKKKTHTTKQNITKRIAHIKKIYYFQILLYREYGPFKLLGTDITDLIQTSKLILCL